MSEQSGPCQRAGRLRETTTREEMRSTVEGKDILVSLVFRQCSQDCFTKTIHTLTEGQDRGTASQRPSIRTKRGACQSNTGTLHTPVITPQNNTLFSLSCVNGRIRRN